MFTNADNRILFDWSAVGISAGAFMDILPCYIRIIIYNLVKSPYLADR